MSQSGLKVRKCALDKDFTPRNFFFTLHFDLGKFSRSLPIDIVWVKFEPNLTKRNGIMLRTNEIGQKDR